MSAPEDERERLWRALHTVDDRVTQTHTALDTIPGEISKAVVAGNIATVQSPEFWAALFAGLHKNTREYAGGWLFGGLRALLSRIGWLILFGVALWIVGGPSAIVAAIKGLTASTP